MPRLGTGRRPIPGLFRKDHFQHPGSGVSEAEAVRPGVVGGASVSAPEAIDYVAEPELLSSAFGAPLPAEFEEYREASSAFDDLKQSMASLQQLTQQLADLSTGPAVPKV